MDTNSPGVSIICNTYNHEKYITEAIESFLEQKTDFPIEILINDDASTDKTGSIIRSFSERYPERIKPLLHTENQDSLGKDASLDFQIPRAKGKYIAMCEGDDYWTDCHKLQKQYDLMEAHPEIDICAHAVMKVKADTKEPLSIVSPSEEIRVFTPEEVIMGGGGFVGTNSLFYRSRIDKSIPQFRRDFPYDYCLQIQGSLRGGMLYLPDLMSAYRVMTVGSWTAGQKDAVQRQKHETTLLRMFQQLDEYTDGKYHDVICERRIKRDFVHLHSDGKYSEMLDKKFKPHFKNLSFHSRVKIFVLGYGQKAKDVFLRK